MDNEGLWQRVIALEAELVVARHEAAAARASAVGADRDVADYRGEMRAHTRSLAALRRTQDEHHAEHSGFARVNTGLADVNTSLARVEAGLQHIVVLLEGPGEAVGTR